jgi:lactobin A/cerein 7B family class IIb bacteriocin
MNRLDVNALGVVELSENEMMEVEGGIAPIIVFLAGMAVGMLIEKLS